MRGPRDRALKDICNRAISPNFLCYLVHEGVVARLGARTASLRQILAELDHDHGGRAECDYHRADKRQFFQQADKDHSDAVSSLHMREAPACYTHRKSPFGPQQQRSDLQREARPGYGQFGCSIDQGEGTL